MKDPRLWPIPGCAHNTSPLSTIVTKEERIRDAAVDLMARGCSPDFAWECAQKEMENRDD